MNNSNQISLRIQNNNTELLKAIWTFTESIVIIRDIGKKNNKIGTKTISYEGTSASMKKILIFFSTIDSLSSKFKISGQRV